MRGFVPAGRPGAEREVSAKEALAAYRMIMFGKSEKKGGGITPEKIGAVFKASGRKKRLFRMSPIHHHFELIGWPETTVIIRFWLISAICVGSALSIFIADYTRVVGNLGGIVGG